MILEFTHSCHKFDDFSSIQEENRKYSISGIAFIAPKNSAHFFIQDFFENYLSEIHKNASKIVIFMKVRLSMGKTVQAVLQEVLNLPLAMGTSTGQQFRSSGPRDQLASAWI